ncbi:MAG: hypothetical protein LKF48_07385 [Prevotella sp.]|jgi:hypothetical protein|nr:hypothetical protein [Prevotella sp.]MCH4182961.1 hypothetical protein [Prevotella sp.]
MKNIENSETQFKLARMFCSYGSCNECPLKNKCRGAYKVENENFIQESTKMLMDWFNADYKEPHKWEHWELESMMHMRKCYKKIHRFDNDFCILNDKELLLRVSEISFPSMKDCELIEIDEELERNGLHR